MTLPASELVRFLADRAIALRGDPSVTVDGVAPVLPGRRGALSFIAASSITDASLLELTSSTIVLIPPVLQHILELPKALVIVVSDPRREFARSVTRFFHRGQEPHIHGTAVISARARMGNNCTIGPHAIVGDDVELGDGCFVGANAVIAAATIGPSTSIGPHSSIGVQPFHHTRGTTASIDDGFSGRVVIGAYVTIGSNTTIARGWDADTVVGDHTKIGNSVHISHDCRIGDCVYVISGTTMASDVTIGNRASVAPGTSIREGVAISDDAVIGLGSVVIGNVPTEATAYGNPARSSRRPPAME